MKDPLKKLYRPSLLHMLFGPIIRWLGDRKEAKRREFEELRWSRVGYFVFTTTYRPSNNVHTHVIEALQNCKGHRKLNILSNDEPFFISSLKAHFFWAIARSWMAGDNRSAAYIRQTPFFPAEEMPKRNES